MRLRHPQRAATIADLKDDNLKGIDYLRKRGWRKVKEDDEPEEELPDGKMTKMPKEAPKMPVHDEQEEDGTAEVLDGYVVPDDKQDHPIVAEEKPKRKYTRKN
jgi:hypothetical protein